MISVAIRWGDKIVDSDLHAISRYVAAIERIIERQHIVDPVVFVTSEDETAIRALVNATSDTQWTILWHDHVRCFQPDNHEIYDYTRLKDPDNKADSLESIISARGENYQGNYKLFSGMNWRHCTSTRSHGKLNLPNTEQPPRVALMSLLNAYLAAEATHTVYTSSSNWGRFILETKQSRSAPLGIVHDLDDKKHGGQRGGHYQSHLL